MSVLKIGKSMIGLIILIMLLFSYGNVYASNQITLTVSDVSADSGESVKVPIQLSNNSGVAGMMFSVTYDKDLTLESINRGDALESLDFTISGDLNANPVNIMFDGLEADDTNGVVAVLNFKVSSNSKKILKIDLSYDKGNIFDNDLNDVEVILVNGTITINNANTEWPSHSQESNVEENEPVTDVTVKEDVIEKEDIEIKEDVETEENSFEIYFTDVNKNDWYYGAVEYAVNNKLFNGISKEQFAPNNLLSRAMLVTVLWRADGEIKIDKNCEFDDVASGMYYEDAVIWAKENGIVTGVSETEFAPDLYITREQIATIMFRYAVYKGYDTNITDINLFSYEDYTDISAYAVEAMQYACASGLIKGKANALIAPKDNATRAETATILQRFLENN